MTLAVAVEDARLPKSGVDGMFWSGPFSEKMVNVTTVPTGTLLASIATISGELEFTITSGIVKVPVGEVATAAPPTVTTRNLGIPVGDKKRPKGVAV